ncbi:unnamed protein product [Zymoseptoria tritici ST99CH_1A5]|uniref:Uncharacterized protein n=1 Tax=Zymoseptoria tritici ST99CH_1A5 TaxID=1276529 RepID=A0A1Y6LQ14_ZYMTR|nr:unnamed protein product [Zymoseptoria tritici ST99CH_1A5]
MKAAGNTNVRLTLPAKYKLVVCFASSNWLSASRFILQITATVTMADDTGDAYPFRKETTKKGPAPLREISMDQIAAPSLHYYSPRRRSHQQFTCPKNTIAIREMAVTASPIYSRRFLPLQSTRLRPAHDCGVGSLRVSDAFGEFVTGEMEDSAPTRFPANMFLTNLPVTELILSLSMTEASARDRAECGPGEMVERGNCSFYKNGLHRHCKFDDPFHCGHDYRRVIRRKSGLKVADLAGFLSRQFDLMVDGDVPIYQATNCLAILPDGLEVLKEAMMV